MWKYNCEKRNKYYKEVIRLYTQKGMGRDRISKIIPVSETTVSNWIRTFVAEHSNKDKAMKEEKQKADAVQPNNENCDINELQAEIARLKKELAHESLKAAAYNEMINVAEKQFNISIRKKAGAKQ